MQRMRQALGPDGTPLRGGFLQKRDDTFHGVLEPPYSVEKIAAVTVTEFLTRGGRGSAMGVCRDELQDVCDRIVALARARHPDENKETESTHSQRVITAAVVQLAIAFGPNAIWQGARNGKRLYSRLRLCSREIGRLQRSTASPPQGPHRSMESLCFPMLVRNGRSQHGRPGQHVRRPRRPSPLTT